MNLHVEMVPIDKIQAYGNNVRTHTQYDIGEIAKSIKKYGFNDPVGIWGDDNMIVEGHGRIAAAKGLGMKEVPCIRLDHLTEKERREYAIIHNKTAELSSWNYINLREEIPELDFSEFDIAFGGIDPITEEELNFIFDASEAQEPKAHTHICPHCGEEVCE